VDDEEKKEEIRKRSLSRCQADNLGSGRGASGYKIRVLIGATHQPLGGQGNFSRTRAGRNSQGRSTERHEGKGKSEPNDVLCYPLGNVQEERNKLSENGNQTTTTKS